MSQMGLGAMLSILRGGSGNSPEKYKGASIVSASIEDERLNLVFEDGRKIQIWDDGQSCCESRYMTTDDNVADLIGGTLLDIVEKYASDDQEDGGSDYGDVHEICFVEVVTDRGSVLLRNHNEHNGYYGGFAMTITEGDKA